MARVLVGCAPPGLLAEARDALEAAGHVVTSEEDAEAILKAARSGEYALVVLSEELEGGTGADVCGVLDGLAGRPRLLFVGPDSPAGADAAVPPEEIFGIVEQALALLELSTASGAIPAQPEVSSISQAVEKKLGWSSTQPPVERVSAKVRAPPPASPSQKAKAPLNGGSRNGAASEELQSLLKKVREADYFEILGIVPDASDAEVRAAYAERRRQVGSFARDSSNKATVDEIQTVLEDALDVLGDPALRSAYRQNRG